MNEMIWFAVGFIITLVVIAFTETVVWQRASSK